MAKSQKKKSAKPKIRHPTKQSRLRVTVVRLGRLLHEDPISLGKSIGLLGDMVKRKRIPPRTFYRVLNVPLAYTTLKKKLRQFSNGEIHFDQLMESVERAYERRVPKNKIEAVVKCREGLFYAKVLRLAMVYSTPKSFVSALTIRRMKYLKMPAEEIAETEKISWGIHQQSHKWHKAEETGKRATRIKRRKRMRALEKIFFEKFAKKL